MWRNMMRSTKSKKVSVLHYSIDDKLLIIQKKKKKICVNDRLL
jgi:hypothetical protein